jgi:hypothetical protein
VDVGIDGETHRYVPADASGGGFGTPGQDAAPYPHPHGDFHGHRIALMGYDGSEGAAMAIRQAGSLLAPWRALVVAVWDSVAGQLLATDLGVSIRELAREADDESEAGAERVAAEGADHARAAGFDPEPAAVRVSPNASRTYSPKPTRSTRRSSSSAAAAWAQLSPPYSAASRRGHCTTAAGRCWSSHHRRRERR